MRTLPSTRALLLAASTWRHEPGAVAWLPRRPPQLFPCRAVMTAATAAAPPSCTLDVLDWLNGRVREALVEAFGPEYADANPMLTAATKPEFGDYQCNVAMGLGKRLKSKPRDVASSIVERLAIDEVCEPVEIAGPGFLNLRLKQSFMKEQLRLMLDDSSRCGVPLAAPSQRVVVDYSSPNIAKEMHVGHLRSTIIGDSLGRLFDFRGHSVLRLNHVGDWGTQFGMLITHLADKAPASLDGAEELDISDLVAFYREAKVREKKKRRTHATARALVSCPRFHTGPRDRRTDGPRVCRRARLAPVALRQRQRFPGDGSQGGGGPAGGGRALDTCVEAAVRTVGEGLQQGLRRAQHRRAPRDPR